MNLLLFHYKFTHFINKRLVRYHQTFSLFIHFFSYRTFFSKYINNMLTISTISHACFFLCIDLIKFIYFFIMLLLYLKVIMICLSFPISFIFLGIIYMKFMHQKHLETMRKFNQIHRAFIQFKQL